MARQILLVNRPGFAEGSKLLRGWSYLWPRNRRDLHLRCGRGPVRMVVEHRGEHASDRSGRDPKLPSSSFTGSR
jgi:hypothetical protein